MPTGAVGIDLAVGNPSFSGSARTVSDLAYLLLLVQVIQLDKCDATLDAVSFLAYLLSSSGKNNMLEITS